MKRWLVMSALFSSCLVYCVARGTKVNTPRGKRNVEDLAVGDEIMVIDPQTLEQHVSVVTAIRRAQRECGRLNDLMVTSAHPLFDTAKNEWAPAGDWLLGVREAFASEDGPTRVTNVERFVGVEEVFDLSVAHELHTFIANGVVVHNKQPIRHECPVPGEDGKTYKEEARCECGDVEVPNYGGLVFCSPDGGAPICDCTFIGDSSLWTTALGTSDVAVRDGTWWSRVERSGSEDVLSVERGQSIGLDPYPVLAGSPNLLNIREQGAGNAAFLERDLENRDSHSVEMNIFKNGAFPRVLSAGPMVVLGVDEDSVWFQPGFESNGEPARRWVARGVPSRVWLQYSWSYVRVTEQTYRFNAYVTWFDGEQEASADFVPEDGGAELSRFSFDGGVFSWGDAGAPTSLRLGHEGSEDGGSGVLKVTRFTLRY